MASNDKLLPDMVIEVPKSMQKKGLVDVPAELPIEDDRGNDNETETDSDSDSDSDSDAEYVCSVCATKFSGYLPLKQHEKGKKHAKMVRKKKMEQKLRERETEDRVSEEENDDDEHFIPEPYANCKTCRKEFGDPESYRKHLKCKMHKRKVLEASILEQVREGGEINEEKLKELYKNRKRVEHAMEDNRENISDDDDDEMGLDEFECKVCEKVFGGLTPYTQHLMSKTHEKQMEKKKLLQKVIAEPSEDKTSDKSKQSGGSTLCIEDDILVCKSCSTSFSGPESAMIHMKSKNHAKNLEKYVRKINRKKRAKDSESDKEKEYQAPFDSSNKSDQPGNPPVEETANPTTSSNITEEAWENYNKYKAYKEMMSSLKETEI